MSTDVRIRFEIPDTAECDEIFEYLKAHPNYIWNYEERVRRHFEDEGLEAHYKAHWTDRDILCTRVARVQCNEDSNIVEYNVTLGQGASDPKILVDLLRRCKNVQEGTVGGNWTIHAWYRGEHEDTWTADAGNAGQSTHYSLKMHTLLCDMKQMLSHTLIRAKI